MNNKTKAFYKAKDLLQYKLSNLDKIIFRLFGRKIVTQDIEGDIGCKITAYGYRGHIVIFDVEYFDAKTSPTV